MPVLQACLGTLEAIFTAVPVPAAMVVGLFLWLFRTPIQSILLRTKSVGPLGLVVRDPTQQQAAAEAAPREDAAQAVLPPNQPPAPGNPQALAERLIAQTDDPFVVQQEQVIREGMGRLGLVDDPGLSRVLMRHTAWWWVMWEFERIWALIFGSQVAALRALNAAPAMREEMLRIFDQLVAANPQRYEGYARDVWVDFLAAYGLIERQQPDAAYELTTKGRSFLIYLVRQQKPEKGL